MKRKKKKKTTPKARRMPTIGVPAPAGVPPVRIPNPHVVEFMRNAPLGVPHQIVPNQPHILLPRAPGTPSILQEVSAPVKIIIHQMQAPGDILMLTAAIRDLHLAYPDKFLTDVRTSTDALFENSPYITKLNPADPDVHIMRAEYPMIGECNTTPFHFVEAFHEYFEMVLGLPVKPTLMKGDMHISDKEKGWYSQIHEILGHDEPFWIIDAGHKHDYTCKMWEFARYQAVVDAFPQITWVQIGVTEHWEEVEDGKGEKKRELVNKGHKHQTLQGPNVINLLDKTDMRMMVRLMYHAAGVITPVSFPMHLAAAVPMKGVYKRVTRPCIVVAGGREPNQWEQYVNQQYLHTCGQLDCCDDGGCWLSRIEKLNDNEHEHEGKICLKPVKSLSGQMIPKCMDMIKVDEVIMHIDRYMSEWNYYEDWNKPDESKAIYRDRGDGGVPPAGAAEEVHGEEPDAAGASGGGQPDADSGRADSDDSV